MNLPEKYQNALNKFVNKWKNDKKVVGIFLTGSFVHSTPDKNSDLDVYILLKDGIYRERGNTWIDGVEIEYFINPIKQAEYSFKTEKKKGSAHMFVNSVILYEKGNQLKNMIKKAKEVIEKPLEPMSKYDIEDTKYYIDDLEKDLEDVYQKKDWFAFELIVGKILNESLETFLKVKRVIIEKPKRLLNYLERIDSKFVELYRSALIEKDYNKQYTLIIKLIRDIENMLGGKRSREWKLKGKCTYLKGDKK